jgi:two-component system, NarL family, captular synthesis response regulator RcsB
MSMKDEHHNYSQPRVILVDDHPISRYGMRVALSASSAAQIVGEAGSAHELFDILKATACDVVLADYVMPHDRGGDGQAMIQRLAHDYPCTPVVIVTALRNRGLLQAALSEGVKGWIEKSGNHTELACAIEEAYAGRLYLGKGMRTLLGNQLEGPVSLTDTEARILSLFAYETLTLGQIAERLGCSYRIVSRHKRTGLAKLGLKNDQELYEYCRWVDLTDR